MQTLKAMAPGLTMIIVGLVFLSQTFVMERASLFDPAGGSFLPALITIVMIITGVIVIIQDQVKKKAKTSMMETTAEENLENEAQHADGAEDIQMTWKQYAFIFIYFVLTILYVLSISILPFSVATCLFLIISMIYLRGVSWKTNILVSIGSVIVFYLVFTRLFHIIFP
ncbi:tripartite tricarboxylate transporter TctB family protein [Oceanobacillus sp. CFH 90083]|uniref:tripartite tricarboxylate transporter TctB family protein n=1 Tax=Oceanobacillus sp. CFH 90083 TaxID=2592336 RepID=UPI00128C9816|nr:tripartite tricarboxylate transporter TctB family protein [Oceanobacillus sp. CFH 90083]